MNGIVVGKRIPIGAAINGAINFSAYVWNITHGPEAQLDILAVGAVSIPLTALAQVIVVNKLGVTQPKS
jgi:hypothetical protein